MSGTPESTRAPFSRTITFTRPDGRIWVDVVWNGTRLSITGEVSHSRGSNRRGVNTHSYGQCLDELGTAPAERRLYTLWERWHLNDMRAGCEHQRAAGWATRPIDPGKPLGAYGRHFPGQAQDSYNMLIWVTPAEHPDGLLGRACPECGYGYGSAWLHEDVPTAVLDELRGDWSV